MLIILEDTVHIIREFTLFRKERGRMALLDFIICTR